MQATREAAKAIWSAAVDAVRPEVLIPEAVRLLRPALTDADRVLVMGAGKAAAAMAKSLEDALAAYLDRMEGVVNVPDSPDLASRFRCRSIRLHVARPPGTNQPTAEAVEGARQMLALAANAGPNDVGLCLISGGGSALLPAPVEGITLADKQRVTGLLHACGATIDEMNTVRKHLSRVKGGRLAQAFAGRELHSLILSDVIGNPLDVIASGPTAADPTTYRDAWSVLEKYDLLKEIPASVRELLEAGVAGRIPETPKHLPSSVHNHIIGDNQRALRAAVDKADALGWKALNLGSYWQGETRDIGAAFAGLVRSIVHDRVPRPAPLCLLSGGETTVTLSADHGKGGRNQEMALALLDALPEQDLRRTVALCGGSDGEDGPTDAAGGFADMDVLAAARRQQLDVRAYLRRHDAYAFLERTGGLLRTGLTHTNVMDIRVMLIGEP